MSKADLLAWADEVLAPTAKLALEGKGEFKAGDHCRFCKVKATCRKRAEYNLEAAKYDFEMPAELEDYEIDAILMMVDRLTEWADDVKDYALAEALKGTEYEHFKVVRAAATGSTRPKTMWCALLKPQGTTPGRRSSWASPP